MEKITLIMKNYPKITVRDFKEKLKVKRVLRTQLRKPYLISIVPNIFRYGSTFSYQNLLKIEKNKQVKQQHTNGDLLVDLNFSSLLKLFS